MPDIIQPKTPDDVRDALRWALAQGRALYVRGGGTKAELGLPMEAMPELDLSGVTGVTLYEPDELVLSARVGTPLAEINALLADKRQMLAFEPPDLGPLWGHEAGIGTLGGVIGANLSGPRRFQAGAARDHVLGVKAVTGFGEPIKSGGRVVKNVSGYDLCKLLTGSYGTLAALTEVTLKVMPRAEGELTLVFSGLDVSAGAALLRSTAKSNAEATGLAYVPERVAPHAPYADDIGGRSLTLVRLEGAWDALQERATALAAHLGYDAGGFRTLDMEESAALWRAVRDVSPFQPRTDVPLWRVSVPPSDAPSVLSALSPSFYLLDWAGGLIWLTSQTRPRLARGSAVLVRGDEAARRRLGFMPEQDPPLAALTRRVKASFDPKGLLNPGRMYEGV